MLAGTNGAGKSSVAGAALRRAGGMYYNPDEATRRFQERYPEMSLQEANARAWRLGRLLLQRAIDQRGDFAFETTLGGRTMTGLLMRASNVGMRVHVWYVGLDSPERNVARVSARVARGGHDIPEGRIRERYDSSRANLVTLLPYLTELKLWDNSREGDPHAGGRPSPELILHFAAGRVLATCPPGEVPEWAKPIVRAAMGVVGR